MAAPKKARGSRNKDLMKGVGRHWRSKLYHKRGLSGAFPTHAPPAAEPATFAGEKKPTKYYPADDVPKPIPNNHRPKPTKLRASITLGTVLILLAGRIMGRKVVFLNQLPSGLLLVTGK